MSYGALKDAVPPPAYQQLCEATGGLIREILELHKPEPAHIRAKIYAWRCHGCDSEGYEAEWPGWPCQTTAVIAQHLGVDLGEAK